MDSQLKAQELSSMILSSSSPPEISAACSAVEGFLRKHVADQMRSFFSIAFPVLIYKIFGFEDASRKSPSSTAGWIDQVVAANDGGLASRVFDLLSPSGMLFTSIFNVDRHSLVKYVFPVERLPEWVRLMLQTEKDCWILSDLCPLFKNRVKEDNAQGVCQVQLNVFEYYMFWFAYYPVCRGNSENTAEVVLRKNRRFRFENWTSSLPVLASTTRCVGQRAEPNLYLRLLYAYLREFVPRYDKSIYQPYRSSLLHYSSSNDGAILLRAEFVVNTLVHYWLVDNDFSPLPVNMVRSFGVSVPFRMVLGETSPTAGLGEVVKVLVKYVNSSSPMENKELGEKNELSGRQSGMGSTVKPSWCCGASVGSWSLVMQRSLYRFILRTFLFCPMGSLKNVSLVFPVWITYMEPWKIATQDLSVFERWDEQSSERSKLRNTQSEVTRSKKSDKEHLGCAYTPSWEGSVISNYLYYTSLVVHFLGFAHKFLHTNVETIIEMVLELLSLLTSSKELTELLKKVDTTYHSKPVGSASTLLDSSYKFIPSIREQLQDWEDGLYESEADGSMHEHGNNDIKLFSKGEDGGHKLLQLLILRAEAEIHAISVDNLVRNLKTLDSLKAQMNCLFGNIYNDNSKSATHEPMRGQPSREEVFTPKHPGFGKRSWVDVKYKGDWMRRPISDNEIAWLARLLVKISDWLNASLGLDRRERSEQSVSCSSWSYVNVPKADVNDVSGSKEAGWMLLSSLVSWILMLGQMALCFMRKCKLRINLRILASKKVVCVFVFCTVICSLIRGFGLSLRPPVLLASLMW